METTMSMKIQIQITVMKHIIIIIIMVGEYLEEYITDRHGIEDLGSIEEEVEE
jgi:hypothetical protein